MSLDGGSFWSPNTDLLIDRLNTYALRHKLPYRIRKEEVSPTIYIVEMTQLKGQPKMNHWLLCKIGFTYTQSLSPDGKMGSRCAKVAKDARDAGHTIGRMWEFPVSFTNTTSPFDEEIRVRTTVGYRVKKEVTKRWNLPAPTEWVATTKFYVDKLDGWYQSRKETRTVTTQFVDDPMGPGKFDSADLPSWLGREDLE